MKSVWCVYYTANLVMPTPDCIDESDGGIIIQCTRNFIQIYDVVSATVATVAINV